MRVGKAPNNDVYRGPSPTGPRLRYRSAARRRRFLSTLLMGVHHFCWFVWEGVVVELAGR